MEPATILMIINLIITASNTIVIPVIMKGLSIAEYGVKHVTTSTCCCGSKIELRKDSSPLIKEEKKEEV